MAAPGVVSDCVLRLDQMFARAEAGVDMTVALEAMTRGVREEALHRGDLAAIVAGVELAAALSTPVDHPETAAERFFNRAAELLRATD